MRLEVENPKTSESFVAVLSEADAPLPWDVRQYHNGGWAIVDANGIEVCDICNDCCEETVAEMIVLAVNTCGSFKAAPRGGGPTQ